MRGEAVRDRAFEILGIDEGEPLMECDGFELRRWIDHEIWDSVITHTCNDWAPNWMSPLDGENHPCPDCEATIPQEILTAWILHNFDGIQRSK